MPPRTYTNPVYDGYFADPFVWRHNGVYYAVGTGGVEAAGAQRIPRTPERVIPLIRSADFVHWEYAGGALLRPEDVTGDQFWAPAVAVADEKFYLYYSVGQGEAGHQLRVAVSERPEGLYEDTGTPLTDLDQLPFAIDAHPFQDDDGQWYLFYARDFLDTENGARAGTALAVDRLETMTRLAGDERVVLRARHDWQLFLANRTMYGQVWDWHTLEGACVVRHDGRYYCFYSGACYGNHSYGVDYAVADHVLGPYSDAGGEAGPRILQTVPGHVFGPGHNSIILGPDDRTEYLVYHAWDADGRMRRMCLDRLVWTPDGPAGDVRPRCDGPTWTPQTVSVAPR